MPEISNLAGFNLSRWALDHPALTRYLMVVLLMLGFASYFQLAQDEDPPFTFRAMVVIEAVVIVLAVNFISLRFHPRHHSGATPLPWWRLYYIDIWPGLLEEITIPLVLGVTFLAMLYFGIGLHKISLGSLIIALGLLVDDAIIAVEMMVRKMEEGYDRVWAATFADEVTAMPMLTGTLITAAGFLPIGLAKSVTGEYTFPIFAVTVIALVLSWWILVYFMPYLGTRLLRTPDHVRERKPGADEYEQHDQQGL